MTQSINCVLNNAGGCYNVTQSWLRAAWRGWLHTAHSRAWIFRIRLYSLQIQIIKIMKKKTILTLNIVDLESSLGYQTRSVTPWRWLPSVGGPGWCWPPCQRGQCLPVCQWPLPGNLSEGLCQPDWLTSCDMRRLETKARLSECQGGYSCFLISDIY